MTPTHLSLFSGIGGIDIAAEWAGFETIGQCEYADYPYQVLLKHWPDVPKWRDVRNVTRESIIERCGRLPDLISGGFPCQPHSLAGKRKASADERDLWGEFARIICEVKPGWVLAENVAGLRSSEDGRFFGRVLRDMAQMGYHVGWGSWGASDVGAPHRRERIFIVAHDQSIRCDTERLSVRTDAEIPVDKIRCHDVENPVCLRGRGRGDGDLHGCECPLHVEGSGCCNVAHSDMQGCEGPELGRASGEGQGPSRSAPKCNCYTGTTRLSQSGLGGVPDGSSGGMDGCRTNIDLDIIYARTIPGRVPGRMAGYRWPSGQWPTPRAGGNRNSRNAIIGMKSGGTHKSDMGLEQAVEVCSGVMPREITTIDELPPQWMARWPAGIGDPHDWEPCRITTIKTNRAKRLTALGNAVVPQQVYPILAEIRRFMV